MATRNSPTPRSASAGGWLHAAARAIADRVSRPGTPLRRMVSPIYGQALHALTGGRGLGIEINGEPFRIDPRFRAVMPPVYEPELRAFMTSRLQAGDCVFDVGANLGVWVLQASRLVGPGGKVVAFEPNVSTADVLRRHARMNGFDDRVLIERRALGQHEGTASLFGASTGAGTSRLGAGNRDVPDAEVAIEVEVTTLDDYCARHGAPNLLLVDVEGFEGDVLAGGIDTIRANPSMAIVVEMHPSLWPPGEVSRLETIMERLGRKPCQLSGQADVYSGYGLVALEKVSR